MLKGIVTGNVGSDVELKMNKSGQKYASFSVAHDRGRNTPTVWVRVAWMDGADSPLLPYLKKGAKVTVIGDLTVSPYMDRSGAPAAGIDLYAREVEMVLFAKRDEGSEADTAAGNPPYKTPPAVASYVQERRTATPMRDLRAGSPGYNSPAVEDMPDFSEDRNW